MTSSRPRKLKPLVALVAPSYNNRQMARTVSMRHSTVGQLPGPKTPLKPPLHFSFLFPPFLSLYIFLFSPLLS